MFSFGKMYGVAPTAEIASPSAAASASGSTNGHLVAFPQGRLYHRSDCVLTVGKDGGTEPLVDRKGVLR